MMVRHSRICGIGSALPKRTIASDELESLYDLEQGWIVKRSGIESRFIGEKSDSAKELGAKAALVAIESSGLNSTSIDTVIVSTSTPELIAPSTACLVAREIGLLEISAFDVSCACAGWMHGVNIARCMLESHAAENVLVVATEMMSRIVDWNDTATSILFGDGAAATILRASEKPGVVSITTASNPSKGDILFATNAIRGQKQGYEEPTLVLSDGPEVFRTSVDTMVRALCEEMEKNAVSIDDIDWLVLHQANYRIITAIANRLGFADHKVLNTIKYHGNTSSASIPLVLDHFSKNEQIQPGHRVLLGAFGSGFSWATGLIIW